MDQPHIIVVGDPGTGKSLILNSLYGSTVFCSGMAVVRGLTQSLQTVEAGGVRYSDTPGLDDVESKEAAAAAIEDAIRHGGAAKMLFVLTAESGRVRGSSLATIRIVLSALSNGGIPVSGKYSVVMNKMTMGTMQHWGDNLATGAETLCNMLAMAAPVDQLEFLPLEPPLVDASGGALSQSSMSKVRALVGRMTTMSVPPGTKVSVPVNEFATLAQSFDKELKRRRWGQVGHVAGVALGSAAMVLAWSIGLPVLL